MAQSKHIAVVVSALFLFSSCAHNIDMLYPAPGDGPTGNVVIKLSDPMEQVSVTVDGRLLVEDEHTARVEVAEIPVGSREVRVVASGESREKPIDHTETVEIEPGRTASVSIATPARSTGYWVYLAVIVGVILIPTALTK